MAIRCGESSLIFVIVIVWFRCVGIWWYPDARSKVKKYFAFPSWSRISVIFGRGKEFSIVRSLNFLKSTTMRSFCFPEASVFFGMTSSGTFHWLMLGHIILLSSIFLICRFISFSCFSGNLYSWTFTGALSTLVVISCAIAVVHVKISCSKLNISQKSSHISFTVFFSSLFKCYRRSCLSKFSFRSCIDS